jgi:hypothetical protein
MNLLRSWIDRGPESAPPGVMSRTFEVPIRPGGGFLSGAFEVPKLRARIRRVCTEGGREKRERVCVCVRGGGKIGADVADFECKQSLWIWMLRLLTRYDNILCCCWADVNSVSSLQRFGRNYNILGLWNHPFCSAFRSSQCMLLHRFSFAWVDRISLLWRGRRNDSLLVTSALFFFWAPSF